MKATHHEVAVLVGHLVQVKERLVDCFLQLHGRLHGVESGSPLVFGRALDVLQNDAPAAIILKLHQLFGVLQLFLGRLPEVLGKAFQGHIVPFKVVRLQSRMRMKNNSTQNSKEKSKGKLWRLIA